MAGIELSVGPYGGRRFVSVPYEEAQVRGLLKRYDIDGDGCLRKDELWKAFKCLGSRAPRIRAFLARFHSDLNRNGLIEPGDEFELLVKYAKRQGYSIY